MNRHSQKGSALLIVLGFLSFMVVSAVAFAIWMRTERLPSSALRRSVANRYLVKAALAQAMSRVDDAIRSHAFPGAWNTNNQNMVYRDRNNCAYDWWESRVFMPPDPEGLGTEQGDPYSRYAPVTKTVSVLNLEALGYLPPAIANDVRLLSRSSWAAKWDYFNFDAGRYAFCAVNVSDFLDISKIAANAPRTSAGAAHPQTSGGRPPSSRFSLAYLFRTSTSAQNDNFSNPSGMDQFDQRVHVSPGQGEWTTAPLVSLMDYNLSLGEQRIGNLWSPFVDLACGANNTRFLYEAAGADTPSVKGAERQPFVTSSWFPPGELVESDGSANTPLDLSGNQPFRAGTLKSGNANFTAVASAVENNFWTAMMYNGGAFSFLDMFSLFDYLDEDDEPVSLAFPCVERVPMLAALGPSGNISVQFTSFESAGEEQAGADVKKMSDIKMKLNVAGVGLGSVLVFPFRGGPTPVACEAQAFGRLVFVAESAGAGGGGAATASISLRNTGFARNFRPLSEAEWTAAVDNDKQFMLEEGTGPGVLRHTAAENCLVVTLPSTGSESWTPSANMQRVQDCWSGGEKFLRFRDAMLEKPIIRKNDYHKKRAKEGGGEDVDPTPYRTTYQILLRPFDENGDVVAAINPESELEDAAFTALCAQYTLRPHLVAWARIKQDGKTVDMVPATYEDDKALNGIDNNSLMLPNGVMMERVNTSLGNFPVTTQEGEDPNGRFKLPILRFSGSMTLTYQNAVAGTQPPANTWDVTACYAVDPRFNWAPENWWFETSGTPNGQKWYDSVFVNGGTSSHGILDDMVKGEYDGAVTERGDRANDPFLFVSNLGYLQSVGELAFLPRLTYMRENGNSTMFSYAMGDTWSQIAADSINGTAVYNGNVRDSNSAQSMPCALVAWKSYQNYRTNPDQNAFEFGANLYRRGLVNGSQGFYVNPYTQSQEIMLAALANTPLNYWVAGTNIVTVQDKTTVPSTFNDAGYHDFMFSDNSAKGVQMTGRDVNKIARFLRHRFEDLANMIEIPQAMSETDIYVYQKVWEDMFDALDWSGTLGCTVQEVYDSLARYYENSGNNSDYWEMYKKENGYSALNRFVKGGGKGLGGTSIKLNVNNAVHKNDLNLEADPLRGKYDGDTGDTSCYSKLFDVDRQFLHSYWRDCFANRQQLFLIFVRAESTALGGTGEGTPAQQGGRAVALVWRSPEAPTENDVFEQDNNQYQQQRHPHKMRILFYRQFD